MNTMVDRRPFDEVLQEVLEIIEMGYSYRLVYKTCPRLYGVPSPWIILRAAYGSRFMMEEFQTEEGIKVGVNYTI